MPGSIYRFSPEDHEAELTSIIEELLSLETIDTPTYEAVLRRHPKPGGGFFSKSHIIQGFRFLNRERDWDLEERLFLEMMRMKPVRTQSGVAPVTVLTKPFPCPGKCIFCPSDVRMPKSYISSEPGAQRAAQHQFDPYAQSFSRLQTYHNIGHSTDKVELIILGGTWSSYAEPYQVWFVARCLEALNSFGLSREEGTGPPSVPAIDYRANKNRVDGRQLDRTYNQTVREFVETSGLPISIDETASWDELRTAQRANESAAARCVGLVVETRPDHLTLDEVVRLRALGATKIQIGYQSLSDEVLRLNNRGHTVATTRRATHLLRQAGFKIHAHWMPNLYGSTPKQDIEDFKRLFADPDFRPDELKIYPCSLVESAELMTYFESGTWRPYSQEELLEVLAKCMSQVPDYCRVTRVVRDIPGTEIVEGNRITNLRELAESRMRESGLGCRDIRAREIRHRTVEPARLALERLDYDTSLGREVFLQFITPEHHLAAFLRLSLPAPGQVHLEEIAESAMIREVHVYGLLAEIGQRQGTRSQHLGLGRRLIEQAAATAATSGYADLAVISAIGTRPYYRQNGFTDGELYQHMALDTASTHD
jgi:elongator complex protein 3